MRPCALRLLTILVRLSSDLGAISRDDSAQEVSFPTMHKAEKIVNGDTRSTKL